jgi:hypothetical protein
MLEEIYNRLTSTPSDINEHLPTLKRYTEECNLVTEMGVRWVVSTYAFLVGKPKKLVSIDIQPPSTWGVDLDPIKQMAQDINCNFQFIQADTLNIDIEPTDLLFIDTWHAYIQLKEELKKHSPQVNKYIILHDTTSYEFTDEESYGLVGNGKGIWPAIEEFLSENSNWILHERFTNNNGLTILKKI